MLLSVLYPKSQAVTSTETDTSLKIVATTLDTIERNDYKKITTKEAVYAGINGMLRTLDPYTQFLDEDAYKYMHEQQQGSFFGIGISFDIRNGELMVISPIEGSPAWKLGLRAGDVIVEIEGKSTAMISSSDVLKQLRGKKGSKVKIAVKRRGVPEPIHFEIVRDKIMLNSVRDGFMLDDETGYIRITEFSSTTSEELLDNLEKLSKQGMKQLMLDLRFNGGGLLAAAEEVSSVFLKKGELIVSTSGRDPQNRMELSSKKNGEYTSLPLIILVNEGSASASEIVAGAVQDHDRGLIVGTTTHGKGLVGSQFPTKLGTAIQITSAQYFTPSGRFIQKPFRIPHRKSEPENTQILEQDKAAKESYLTDKGRRMFGGGGITPDIVVEEPLLTSNMFMLENPRVFFDFAIDRGNTYKPITVDFVVTEEIFQDFLNYCSEKSIQLDTSEIENDKAEMINAIKREFLSVYINTTEGEKARIETLHIVIEARKFFPELEKYLQTKANG